MLTLRWATRATVTILLSQTVALLLHIPVGKVLGLSYEPLGETGPGVVYTAIFDLPAILVFVVVLRLLARLSAIWFRAVAMVASPTLSVGILWATYPPLDLINGSVIAGSLVAACIVRRPRLN